MTHSLKKDGDPWAVGWAARALVLVAFITAFAVPARFIPIITVAADTAESPAEEENSAIIISLTHPKEEEPEDTPIPVTPTPHIPQVGIIAGHTGSDSGALCPDGLREVDINTDVARRVVALLTAHGWQADLLEEFDTRLNDYQADALLSIHADSCTFPGKTGFKVAGAEASYNPRITQHLVDCVSRYYEKRTGLPFDPYTITYDMTHYHAYREISHTTPAVIIETGFMLDDREILTQHPDVVAQGIVDGLICFIEGEIE